jgi:DNA-binding PadR family transcriptional regulator
VGRSEIYRSFVHGMVGLFVLHRARCGPVYGGALSKALADLGYEISPGRLYPLLHGLQMDQLLCARRVVVQGRTRKYYELTDKGLLCLEELRGEISGLVGEILFPDTRPAEGT